MTSLWILLVALVVVGLCKGAAIEKKHKPARKHVEPSPPLGSTLSQYWGRKKREVEENSPSFLDQLFPELRTLQQENYFLQGTDRMRGLSILLVALAATCLCKGAAIEKREIEPAAEGQIAPGPPNVGCQIPSLCGRKKREVEQERPVEAILPPTCSQVPSLCGRKKREVEQESPVEAIAPPTNSQGPVISGRKKREVEQESPVELGPPLGCTGPVSLCGRKKREAKPESPVRSFDVLHVPVLCFAMLNLDCILVTRVSDRSSTPLPFGLHWMLQLIRKEEARSKTSSKII
ncbi:unnamed protein product [Nezara viridula]|uniref:Neuropeptide n=1 Tax=Nezara viridula TaxID=85310 RepID=A0A9P0MS11_NEZVI|nr:unnamed protein product [Nezara viridula]